MNNENFWIICIYYLIDFWDCLFCFRLGWVFWGCLFWCVDFLGFWFGCWIGLVVWVDLVSLGVVYRLVGCDLGLEFLFSGLVVEILDRLLNIMNDKNWL